MTRQMADDEVLRVLADKFPPDEVLDTLDDDLRSGKRPCPVRFTLSEARDFRSAVAALRAQRNALEERVETLRATADRATERADANAAALEALRGQVAGLLNTCVDVIEEGLCASQSYDYRARAQGCAEQIKEMLAIKERMG